MASCRSRRTGNCSDYSQNRLLQEKDPESFPESSIFQDRRAYAAVGVRSQYPWEPRD